MKAEESSSLSLWVILGLILISTLMIVVGVVFFCCKSSRLYRWVGFYHPEMNFRQDLLQEEQQVDQLWLCQVCQFHNYQSASNCLLCGTQRDTTESRLVDSSALTNDQRIQLHHLNDRQRQARRRNDWIRHVESDGGVSWFRERTANAATGTDQDISNHSKAGYVSSLAHTPRHTHSQLSVMQVNSTTSKPKLQSNPAPSFTTDLTDSDVSDAHFQVKEVWFYQRLSKLQVPWDEAQIKLKLPRTHVFERSCEVLNSLTERQLHAPLRVQFEQETGVDAGGLEREWYTLMTQEIFTQKQLFLRQHNNTYFINPASGDMCPNHLQYFQAIGRFFGRAIFDAQCIPAHIALPLYKHMVRAPITLRDLEFLDAQLYTNLKWVKHCKNVEELGLYFSVSRAASSSDQAMVDLIPNGSSILVTEESKMEYVNLYWRWVMIDGIREQLEALLTGVFAVVPQILLSIYDHQELELLFCGVPEINVEDWREHTTYSKHVAPELICWFWDIVLSFTGEQRARLLQFTTGSARVPIQGFKALTMNDGRLCRFHIESFPLNKLSCPRSHTCFNRLDLPEYTSKEQLEEALLLLLSVDITGFTIE